MAKLGEHLDKANTVTAFGMEISAKKTKLMTNNTSSINMEIKINGQKLETPEKSETELTASVLKKRSKTHKRLMLSLIHI